MSANVRLPWQAGSSAFPRIATTLPLANNSVAPSNTKFARFYFVDRNTEELQESCILVFALTDGGRTKHTTRSSIFLKHQRVRSRPFSNTGITKLSTIQPSIRERVLKQPWEIPRLRVSLSPFYRKDGGDNQTRGSLQGGEGENCCHFKWIRELRQL